MGGDLGPFWLSLRVATVATLVIVALGLPLAWILARVRFPGRELVAGLMTLPLVLPPTVVGYVLLRLFGQRGPAGQWLLATFGIRVVFHWSGAVIAAAVAAFPLFLLPARSAFEGVDPALEDAARLLGRSEPAVWRHVTLPLAWRGLAAGTALAYARALGDFGATLMMAGDIPGSTQTAALAIYDAVQAEDASRAVRLSVLIAAASIAAVLVAQRASPRLGAAALSGLVVEICHRVHPGLTLKVAFRLGAEVAILFGPSGAGKTTLLRIIAGLQRPDSGMIHLDDATLCDRSAKVNRPLRTRRVGVIYQDDLLFPHLNVRDNVRFGLHRWSRAEAEARLLAVAALCGVGPLLHRWPATLSGGERQRVGLARALAPRPRLLLCDEPVSALDLDARFSLIERVKAVQAAESIPVLYVTHAADEAVALGTQLFFLQAGRIMADGDPLDVLAARGSVGSVSIRNLFSAVVEEHDGNGRSTRLRVVDGPTLAVGPIDRPVGTRVRLQVLADDVVLARGAIGAVSARNLVAGTVERVVRHGHEAEVVVRTGGVHWVVGVVADAVAALGLIEGVEVRMIVKARSCRVVPDE